MFRAGILRSSKLGLQITLALALAACRQVSLPAHASPSSARAFITIGYLPDYRLSTVHSERLGKEYTDIILFSVEPTAAGGIDSGRLDPRGFKLVPDLKQSGVKRVWVCIGGSQRSQAFATAVGTPETRHRLIGTLITLCQHNGLAGVDFDWEHPKTAQEQASYARLIVEAKQAMKSKGLLVSVAVATWHELDRSALAAADRVNLMAYDAPGEHSTYEFATSSSRAWIDKGVPASHLCLGVPFYARGVKHHHSSLSYATLAARDHPAPEADQAGDFYFNGTATLSRKATYARRIGLAGIMVWEVGQDTPDCQLAEALKP